MEPKLKKRLEKFLEQYRLVKYRKNELLHRPGDTFTKVKFIKSGEVRIYTICKNGQEVTVGIIDDFSFSPTYCSATKLKNRYYAEAMNSVEVWELPQKELCEFLIANPDLFPELMSSLTQLFQQSLNRIEYLASGDAYTKVVGVLLSLLKDNAAKKTSPVTLDLSATHRIIASLTGLTRETVTIQMLKLKKKGFISGKGRRLVITNPVKLREEGSCAPEEN